MVWGGDLRAGGDGWSPRRFRGTRWEQVRQVEVRRYVLNKYRVLLTRAREGMAIVVPRGAADDPTRAADVYDATFAFLCRCGVPVV